MLEITPRAARGGLGEYTPDPTLVNRLNAFEANASRQDAQSFAAVFGKEVTDWATYLLLLQNKFVPMLLRFQSHYALGADARALLPLVQAEITRGGYGLNTAGANLRLYGGTPAYGFTAGVGVRAL